MLAAVGLSCRVPFGSDIYTVCRTCSKVRIEYFTNITIIFFILYCLTVIMYRLYMCSGFLGLVYPYCLFLGALLTANQSVFSSSVRLSLKPCVENLTFFISTVSLSEVDHFFISMK